MKIQYVSISPTTTAENQGCYALTPELLAATGARYSRNNEGLDAIVSKIDFSNTDKSVDGIFKMVDSKPRNDKWIRNVSLFAKLPLFRSNSRISLLIRTCLW